MIQKGKQVHVGQLVAPVVLMLNEMNIICWKSCWTLVYVNEYKITLIKHVSQFKSNNINKTRISIQIK